MTYAVGTRGIPLIKWKHSARICKHKGRKENDKIRACNEETQGQEHMETL